MIRTMNGTAQTTPTSTRRHKQRVTVFLPSPLIERLRNAVYWTGDRPLAQIIADAIEDAVTEMEHANGGVFPARLAQLKPGRPRRSRLPESLPADVETTME
jgi:hypothetical protein